jgi:hypothetical protein
MTIARRSIVESFLLVVWCCAPAWGQQFRIWQVVEFAEDVQVAEADNVARSHLETIDRFVEAGQWDEAIEALRRLMDTDGDKLLALDDRSGAERSEGEFLRYVSLRDYCQMRLAAMHGKADQVLVLYRARVDPLAENWFREAIGRRRCQPLAPHHRTFLRQFLWRRRVVSVG